LAKINATDYNTEWIDNFATQTKNEVKLGQTLAKGAAVYVSSANGTNMIVSAASNTTEALSSKTFGLLETGGVLNDFVKCVTFGLLAGLDTSTATAGDPVWLGVNGALIFGLANKPYAPAHLVYIGVVTRVQSNNGEIFVNVQNGFELKEIHDVYIADPANNHGLFYDLATGLWKNKSIVSALGYTPQAQLNGTGFVKATGTTISYDNSTYLTTADAASTYQLLTNLSTDLTASATKYPSVNAVVTGLGTKQPLDADLTAIAALVGTTGFLIKTAADTWALDTNTYLTTTSAASTYLTQTTAASTYQRLDKMVSNLLASSTEYPNSNAVLAKLALKADAANPVFTGDLTISGATPRLYFVDTDQNPDYTLFVDSGYFYIYDQTAGATKFQITPSGNAINTGTLTSASFIKSGGTSSQYLMADGSVTTGPNLNGYVPYTGATTNVDLGSRTLTTSLLFVNPVASLASGAVIRTYNYSDPNWGFSNTQAAGVDSNQYHVRVHGSGGTYGTLRQFQVIDASQSNNVRFGVNFDGSGAVLSSGLGLGGNFPTADRQFVVSGTSFTSGTLQYQAVFNTTFVNAASNLYGIYVHNNTSANVTNSYSLFVATTGGSGTVTNKWGIYQTGSSDNNYFAGKVLVNTNTDAGYKLYVNGDVRFENEIWLNSSGQSSLVYMQNGSLKYNIAYNTIGYLQFYNYVAGSISMNIFNNGNIGMGSPADNGNKLQVSGNASFTGSIVVSYNSYDFPSAVVMANDQNWAYGIAHPGSEYWMQVKYYGVGDDSRGWRVYNVNGNTIDFRVNGLGNGVFRGSVTGTAFFESSDFRLKTLINDNPIVAGIENLQAKLYEKNGKLELGYFAQDAEKIMPYAVTKNADGFLNLSYREIHTAKIARLEKEVAQLKAQLNLN
jgi:hypothetical protein